MKNKYYCGPYYLPEKLKKPISFVFNNACLIHDQDYSAKTGRIKADFVFLANMMKQLVQLMVLFLKTSIKLICGPIMLPIMFLLVLIFGFISYNKDP